MGRQGRLTKVREICRRLEAEGWAAVRQTGDHRHYRHPERPGLVTIDLGVGEVPIGTLRSIYRQAGWTW
jgi:predicted RNA binding protein YcfA (HicA-like mRNA interferase family)